MRPISNPLSEYRTTLIQTLHDNNNIGSLYMNLIVSKHLGKKLKQGGWDID